MVNHYHYLDNFSYSYLNSLIDNNLNDYCRLLAKNCRKEPGVTADLQWVETVPRFWANCIFHAELNEDNLDQRLQEIKRQIGDKLLPSEWLIGPNSRPTYLKKYKKVWF